MFKDLFTGVKIRALEGWSPYHGNWYITISSIQNMFKSYGVAILPENIDKSIKKFLVEVTKTLHSANIASNPSIRIEGRNDRLRIGERRDILPGRGSLITRFKAKSIRDGTIIYFWQYVEEDNSFPTPSILEELVDNAGVGERIPSYQVVIRDSDGTPAFTILVPRYWMYNGFVNAAGELVFGLQDEKGVFTLNIPSTAKYFYTDNMWMAGYIAQSLVAYGYQYAPYTSIIDYASRTLSITPHNVIDVSPPQLLSPYIGEVLAAKSTGLWGNIESKILVAGDKVLWITIYGYQLPFLPTMSLLLWNAHIAVMSGPRDPELLRSLLLSIVSHIQLNPVWARKKIREANAKAKSALRSIRSNRIGPISLSTGSSNIGTSYYGYSANSYEGKDYGIADTLGNLWDSNDYQSSDKLSDYDWASGRGTFYIDYEGHIRSYDYAEEIVADHIGSDGTLYDENDNPIGLVDEGYVYDNEGNRIGRIDFDSSDSWWSERYQQEIPGYERVMGQTSFGANSGDNEEEITPYYASKKNKDNLDNY